MDIVLIENLFSCLWVTTNNANVYTKIISDYLLTQIAPDGHWYVSLSEVILIA